MLSSVLAFIGTCSIKSCASAFCFNQSLKSRSSGFTQCFWTVQSEHDSFILGGNSCTALLTSEKFFKSASYESDVKTPTRLEIFAVLFTMLSLLCIISGGKELSLSKCALTTACAKCLVLSASLYIILRYASSLIAVFAFPVRYGFNQVSLTSSVSDFESKALLKWPNPSCHCRG